MTARDTVVRWAVAQQGKGYRAYRDCSGFTAAAFRQAGITIPEGSVAQYSVGVPVHDYSSESGLLHFWDTFGAAPGHVALGVGGGQIVHALNEQRGIVVSDVRANMGGRGRYMGARRLFDANGVPLTRGDAPQEPPVSPPDQPDVAGRSRRNGERERRRLLRRMVETVRRRRGQR